MRSRATDRPAAALAAIAFAALALDGPVRFEGSAVSAKELPASVPAAAREAAARVEPLALQHALRIHVAAGDPLVLVAPASFQAGGVLSRLRAVEASFAKRLKAPAPSAALELVHVEKKAAYDAYVDLLASRHDYLKPWAPSAKGGVGFTLLEPFAAAWRRDPAEKTEARAPNQLVHQLAHLLLNAAHGRQPYWAQEAIAWSFEQASEGAIYAFCHREGFVGVKEHSGWPALGRKWLATQTAFPPPAILAMKRSGPVTREVGAAAMVLVDHLLAKHPDAFGKLLGALRDEIAAKHAADGEIAPERQAEIWNDALGEVPAREVAEAFRKP